MKVLTLGLFLLLTLSVVTVPTIFADEDDDDDDEEDDDDGLALGGGIPDAILYSTIAVIAGSVGYTGYKIYNAKKPKTKSS